MAVVKHVLVCVDGSARSASALEEAVALTGHTGARLTVLSLANVEEPGVCCNRQTTFWNREMRRLAEEAAARARRSLSPDIEARFVVREGQGRAAIDAAAAELGCDLVVEGGRRGRVRTRALGAVAH